MVLAVRFALTLATFSTSCLCWLGYASKHLRPVSITGLVPASGNLSSGARSEVKMVGVPGNAPGLGTHLVRCGV